MVQGIDSILPSPRSWQPAEGVFAAGPGTPVRHDRRYPELATAARLLAEIVGAVDAGPGEESDDGVFLTLDSGRDDPGAEGYELRATPRRVLVRASTETGVFHGTQTLRQLWPAVPAGVIQDAPAFRWRGLLLDCCRHFLPVEQVLGVVDRLALHKMNRLHWHLTEDQGWRLPVEAYPRLAEISAWRVGKDGRPYGGAYTRDEVRRVVEYARARQVLVVPEVEMPGHATAALAAYPALSCRGVRIPVETRWGIFEDVYCAGNDEVFRFLETVLEETLELFPSRWIHVGGDEVPKDRWRECPRCQARMRREGLRDEAGLQSWFLRRIDRFLSDRRRRLVGWDEILEGGLAPGATVQSWRGLEGAVAACRAGHDTIVSPTSHCYLDYDLEAIDLARAFSFDPVPPGLTDAERAHVLGGECCMWTERAPPETVDRKMFPRLLAIAERLWRGTDGGFGEFQARARAHYPRLAALGIEVGPEVPDPDHPPAEPFP